MLVKFCMGGGGKYRLFSAINKVHFKTSCNVLKNPYNENLKKNCKNKESSIKEGAIFCVKFFPFSAFSTFFVKYFNFHFISLAGKSEQFFVFLNGKIVVHAMVLFAFIVFCGVLCGIFCCDLLKISWNATLCRPVNSIISYHIISAFKEMPCSKIPFKSVTL